MVVSFIVAVFFRLRQPLDRGALSNAGYEDHDFTS